MPQAGWRPWRAIIFEGLAENLAEERHPHPVLATPAISQELVQRFWDAVRPHQDLEGWDAYFTFLDPSPDLPEGIGYTIAYWVVRRFLERTGLRAVEAQWLPFEEILKDALLVSPPPLV